MHKPLYVGDFADANKLGSYINQIPLKKIFCEHSSSECRLGAQNESQNESTDSQWYIPSRQYGELSLSEEMFLDQLIIALEKLNANLHKELLRY